MRLRAAFLFPALFAAALPYGGSAADRVDRVDNNADYIMWAYAECLVRRNTDEARSVFGLLPQSSESNRMLEELQRPACLRYATKFSIELRFDHTLIRGAMAEHLYERDDRDENPIAIYDPNADVAHGSYEQRYDFVFIRATECALAGAPEAIDRVLATRVGSDEESAELAKVAQLLSPCLDDGVNVNLTSAMLRSYVAEAALRRSAQAQAIRDSEAKTDA
ncbi:hypothetical protein [uncultured Erythrobacter sp.]|uniref:hypothetical protein n=1 Tax=uncultured Erythrobacter sp. TaxID=263913 RepID=UPI00260C3960|nr:hypothetical protein [uncultured Erythrobacter sp.]